MITPGQKPVICAPTLPDINTLGMANKGPKIIPPVCVTSSSRKVVTLKKSVSRPVNTRSIIINRERGDIQEIDKSKKVQVVLVMCFMTTPTREKQGGQRDGRT